MLAGWGEQRLAQNFRAQRFPELQAHEDGLWKFARLWAGQGEPGGAPGSPQSSRGESSTSPEGSASSSKTWRLTPGIAVIKHASPLLSFCA